MDNDSFVGTILVVDDDDDIRAVLKDRLELLRYQVLEAPGGNEALALLEKQNVQMVLLDVVMPEMDGLVVLREIRNRGYDVTVIMITAFATIERAVQAMKQGAYDFIPKPFEPDHIALIVDKALERENLRRGLGVLTEELDDRHRLIVGKSPAINRAVDVARKAAASRSTVLLLGESGTGKEIFARAIHKWSDRKSQPFIAINCVGLSKDLLESTLFGHERGAFTGAVEQKKGKMELAHGGTVFLDEVGDISLELQTKLLRFLQEREFERVGGTKPIRVDVRIIAATNRDLKAAVQNLTFRQDLFYRLNVVPLTLPPLRARREDIPDLVSYLLRRFALETKKYVSEIGEEALRKLVAYDWPGNVRELANVIERAIVLGQPPTIQEDDLPFEIFAVPRSSAADKDLNYHETVDAYRRELIVKRLQQAEGNRTTAAKLLGLERAYFQKLLKSFGIS